MCIVEIFSRWNRQGSPGVMSTQPWPVLGGSYVGFEAWVTGHGDLEQREDLRSHRILPRLPLVPSVGRLCLPWLGGSV